MAWRCSGSTNAELIKNLANRKIIHSERVIQAMLNVDRANYVHVKSDAYQDSPQFRLVISVHGSISYGATISAPHMHAYASEALLPYLHPGAKVLDVGSGSGYLVAVLHHLVGPTGKVVGIEHVPELVDWSVKNLNADGLGEFLQNKQIEMIAGDGREGYASGGPYDAIHVGAAAPTVPSALIAQLASPGLMFIPVGTYSQYIQEILKDENGKVTQRRVMAVSYVPLTDREVQASRLG